MKTWPNKIIVTGVFIWEATRDLPQAETLYVWKKPLTDIRFERGEVEKKLGSWTRQGLV